MLRTGSFTIIIFSALACAVQAELVVRVQDAIRVTGRTAQLSAEVRREHSLSLHDPKKGVEVSFSAGGRHVGTAQTNRRGVASLQVEIEGDHPTYQAAAVYKGRVLAASGRLFTWDPARTVIAIDVDDTICKTKYSDLFISSFDRKSPAIEGSAEALRKLAARFHIAYISARPAWLTEKTRQWLDENGYPRGPVLHQGGWESCLRQTAAKREILRDLRRDLPNVLVGIGDRSDDAQAFQDNAMVSLLVRDPKLRRIDGAMVFNAWSDLDCFLDKHGESLARAEVLAEAIAANRVTDLLGQPTDDPPRPQLVSEEQPDASLVASGRMTTPGDSQDALD